MPKKPAKRTAARKTRRVNPKAVAAGNVVLYGPVIWDTISRGNVLEMKSLAQATRKHVAGVQAALQELNKAIRKKSA